MRISLRSQLVNWYRAYDNLACRTQDAGILVDAHEYAAAFRPNFALRSAYEKGDKSDLSMIGLLIPADTGGSDMSLEGAETRIG
jgi:hypothetical protein